MPNSYKDFISFLANRLPSDGLTKAQIIRMADRLTHGGTWDGEKVVLEERTPLEMAQSRILELEAELDKAGAERCPGCPVIWGEDAERFLAQMQEAETSPLPLRPVPNIERARELARRRMQEKSDE